MNEREGWAWFSEFDAAPDDTAGAFARCFGGGDGMRVLGFLKAMTLERAVGPEASDAALRHLEGQRQLVTTILALVARGRSEFPQSPS